MSIICELDPDGKSNKGSLEGIFLGKIVRTLAGYEVQFIGESIASSNKQRLFVFKLLYRDQLLKQHNMEVGFPERFVTTVNGYWWDPSTDAVPSSRYSINMSTV